jgi:hypothetical protein
MALASRLPQYGFVNAGALWDLHRSAFPAEPAIYAFVAVNGIADYHWQTGARRGSLILRRLPATDEESAIAPSEIFYIGASECMRKRIDTYRSTAKRGCPPTMEHETMLQASKHQGTWILRIAWEQNAPVDVYVRLVPSDLGTVSGLPVDLLHGWEAGLIRELDPRGNHECRRHLPGLR